jgi:hypothetical protein
MAGRQLIVGNLEQEKDLLPSLQALEREESCKCSLYSPPLPFKNASLRYFCAFFLGNIQRSQSHNCLLYTLQNIFAYLHVFKIIKEKKSETFSSRRVYQYLIQSSRHCRVKSEHYLLLQLQLIHLIEGLIELTSRAATSTAASSASVGMNSKLGSYNSRPLALPKDNTNKQPEKQ